MHEGAQRPEPAQDVAKSERAPGKEGEASRLAPGSSATRGMDVLRLQRAAGNRAVTASLASARRAPIVLQRESDSVQRDDAPAEDTGPPKFLLAVSGKQFAVTKEEFTQLRTDLMADLRATCLPPLEQQVALLRGRYDLLAGVRSEVLAGVGAALAETFGGASFANVRLTLRYAEITLEGAQKSARGTDTDKAMAKIKAAERDLNRANEEMNKYLAAIEVGGAQAITTIKVASSVLVILATAGLGAPLTAAQAATYAGGTEAFLTFSSGAAEIAAAPQSDVGAQVAQLTMETVVAGLGGFLGGKLGAVQDQLAKKGLRAVAQASTGYSARVQSFLIREATRASVSFWFNVAKSIAEATPKAIFGKLTMEQFVHQVALKAITGTFLPKAVSDPSNKALAQAAREALDKGVDQVTNKAIEDSSPAAPPAPEAEHGPRSEMPDEPNQSTPEPVSSGG